MMSQIYVDNYPFGSCKLFYFSKCFNFVFNLDSFLFCIDFDGLYCANEKFNFVAGEILQPLAQIVVERMKIKYLIVFFV